MKCPKCRGLKYQTVRPTHGGKTYLSTIICPYCDESGEIKEGDVWKCDVEESGQCYTTGRTVEAYFKYTADGWISGQHIYMDYMVTPKTRMKEVK